MAIRASVAAFRRAPGVVALYLSRGGAKQRITPGVSDIDFVVITSADPGERQRVEATFARLDRWSFGLIPYSPFFVMNEAQMHLGWRTHAFRRYRLEEGRRNWRLLLGRDVLRSLPAITEEERASAAFAEMNYWWSMWAYQILIDETCRRDWIMRRSICVKAASEVANILHAQRTGEVCYSREEALRREDSSLFRRLQAAAHARLPGRDPELEEEVYRYLTDAFLDLWDSFRERPFLPVHQGVAQTVDAPVEEMAAEMAQAPFQRVRRYLEERWGDRCSGMRLLRSAYYPLDLSLLLIDVNRDRMPTLAEVVELLAVRAEAYAGERAAFFVLRAGEVGFPITPIYPRDLIRGVLTPATAPDVFLQLGISPVYWTSHSRWYLTDWETNGQWLEATAAKQEQLRAIVRSESTGTVHYPLRGTGVAR